MPLADTSNSRASAGTATLTMVVSSKFTKRPMTKTIATTHLYSMRLDIVDLFQGDVLVKPGGRRCKRARDKRRFRPDSTMRRGRRTCLRARGLRQAGPKGRALYRH